ncbi:MAG: cell wall-binding repeat-containing protein [Coriobacteriia bacterium]|nr:cell wall-binding repeat-containing protein [Coriobacteriia bacterium]
MRFRPLAIAVSLLLAAMGGPQSAANAQVPAPLPQAPQALAVTITPIHGADRISTAIECSKHAFSTQLSLDSEGYRTVVLATGWDWPDALGAASLAGAVDGPVLLTNSQFMPTRVAAEIVRLGADRVIVVGGQTAVFQAVADTCLDIPGVTTVERLSGPDRYATSVAIADRVIGLLGDKYTGGAFFATGRAFPDALGASPIAAANGYPIYLVPPASTLRTDIAASLKSHEVTTPVLLGGTTAIGTSMADSIRSITGVVPVRLSGSTRYETAISVADWAVITQAMRWDKAAIATGLDFPDAISGAVLQGRTRSVLLLTDPQALSPAVEQALDLHREAIFEVRFLGGEYVLTNELREQVIAVLAKL